MFILIILNFVCNEGTAEFFSTAEGPMKWEPEPWHVSLDKALLRHFDTQRYCWQVDFNCDVRYKQVRWNMMEIDRITVLWLSLQHGFPRCCQQNDAKKLLAANRECRVLAGICWMLCAPGILEHLVPQQLACLPFFQAPFILPPSFWVPFASTVINFCTGGWNRFSLHDGKVFSSKHCP